MKKSLVAIISAVLMTAGLVAGSASAATAAENPYAGTIAVGNTVKVAAPYQFGRVNAAKPMTVFFGGADGNRVPGTLVVATRKIGTGNVTARNWDFSGTTTRVWTAAFQSTGNFQVTLTFYPDDDTYRVATRQFNIWVTRTGRP